MRARQLLCKGFSLLELLVVLLIIGLAVGVASLIGGGNRALQLKADVQQWANRTALVAEEAVLENTSWGVDIYRDFIDGRERYGYRWLVYRDHQWQSATLRDIPIDTLFTQGSIVQLTINDLPQVIAEKRSLPVVDPAHPWVPDIWLLPNGEITPFVLTLSDAADTDIQYVVRGDLLGRIGLESRDG